MPNDNTRNTITRHWELLKLLPSGGSGKTSADLTLALNNIGFNVSKRTVERDLNALMEPFPTIERNDEGSPYGWRWARGTSVDLPGIALADALSLRIIGDTIKSLLPTSVVDAIEPRLRQAEEKLANQKKQNNIARWTDKVRSIPPVLPLLPPQIDSTVLETVQSALLQEVQLEVDYHSMDADEPRTRTLHPIALVQRGPVTYLVATTNDYEDVRIYALHRIVRAERLTARVKSPSGFNIDAYIESGAFQFGNGETLKLKAKVAHWLARILRETPLGEDQKIVQKDKEFVITVTVADSPLLQWWVLSYGDAIEVVGPRSLRRRVADALLSASLQYHRK